MTLEIDRFAWLTLHFRRALSGTPPRAYLSSPWKGYPVGLHAAVERGTSDSCDTSLEEQNSFPSLRAFSHPPTLVAPRRALDPCDRIFYLLP